MLADFSDAYLEAEEVRARALCARIVFFFDDDLALQTLLLNRAALERQATNERSIEMLKSRRQSLVGKALSPQLRIKVAHSGVADEEWAEDESAPSTPMRAFSERSEKGKKFGSEKNEQSEESERTYKKKKAPLLVDSYESPKPSRVRPGGQ
jgi:hypothetical protein